MEDGPETHLSDAYRHLNTAERRLRDGLKRVSVPSTAQSMEKALRAVKLAIAHIDNT